ncbi:MAG TPA: DUF4922 domain-containing protein [Gammaproteobacteria bacterium]|nr:DUF4922 domain-containing protein [Gammaproteobacteria bacterium]
MAPARDEPLLTPDSLWPRVATVAARALASGALEPIETRSEPLEDAGLRFVVRLVSSLRRKHRDGRAADPSFDPFRPPYQPGLWAGDLSATHAVVLNKFNVLPQHLLLVTRHFEHQTQALSTADFAALWSALAGQEALGFYNAGARAGASQPHKHLQVVPLPLAPELPEPALATLFRRHAAGGRAPELAFVHAFAPVPARWLEDPAAGGRESGQVYRELLRAVGLAADADVPGAYNLLATRRWLWLVPRRRAAFDGIGVNALGFAGALLVRDTDQLERLRRHGPLRVLREVGRPGRG